MKEFVCIQLLMSLTDTVSTAYVFIYARKDTETYTYMHTKNWGLGVNDTYTPQSFHTFMSGNYFMYNTSFGSYKKYQRRPSSMLSYGHSSTEHL